MLTRVGVVFGVMVNPLAGWFVMLTEKYFRRPLAFTTGLVFPQNRTTHWSSARNIFNELSDGMRHAQETVGPGDRRIAKARAVA